ncbi:MEDS domain-containing protein [Geodermatophilus poikilotrophus]|uniref:STAS domain-containing protein n=1 Tax=Geodermatophilus poikilotrophus TaxID=1333667 RepID=A0A1I0DQ91_9ACTN|nr:MEDS domain-containing protein [Geodermatophilus poikilotrophus]SET34697.1 hypothetical protein SAMN04488546_2083 [Geodermatophilus poikilotrophus]
MTAAEATTRGQHGWVVLDSELAHEEVVGDFVLDGLQQGDCVLLAGMGAPDENVRRRLQRAGVELGACPDRGRAALRAVPPDPAALVASVDSALDDGFPGVRFSGAITEPGAGPFEPVVDELARTRPLTVLCPYLSSLLGSQREAALDSLHDERVHAPAAYDDDSFRLSRRGEALRLTGELDGSNTEALRAVLAATAGQDGGSRVWDVSDLHVLDVSAADALVAAAGPPPGLTVRGATPLLGRLLTAVAADSPDAEVRIRATPHPEGPVS